jgi:peptidoglycan/LPS O-acetylase OafA/YrhL
MYYSIQFCRAIAALLVVLFHSGNLAKEKYFGVFAEPVGGLFYFGGEAGVAFFFVLSGFIIHQVHAKEFNRPDKLLLYLRKRAIRVYPTYILLFMLVYTLASLMPTLKDGLPTDVGVLIKSLFLIPQDSKSVGGSGAPVIVVAWSLQYEMFFYVVFATAFIRRWLFYTVGLILLAACLLQPLLGTYSFPLSFVSNHLITLFGLGVLTSIVVNSQLQIRYLQVLIISAGITFLIIGCWVTEGTPNYIKVITDIGFGLTSAILIFALARYETQYKLNSWIKKASILGDSSYALYLIHFPLISVLSKLCVVILPINTIGAYVAYFILVSGCVFVAVCFHVFLESPMLKFFKHLKT